MMNIKTDDLSGPQIRALLEEHFQHMLELSPPGSCHFLDFDGLRQPDVMFWAMWEGDQLAGCGALKELNQQHGEIKSMRTAKPFLRRGVARLMLGHILSVAAERGYQRLSLETGSMAGFEPARQLYTAFGFEYCAPFADYTEDPNSVYMSKKL
jgi:putative acetyltransferase